MPSVKCTTRILVGLSFLATLYSNSLDYAHEMCTCTCPDPSIRSGTTKIHDYVSVAQCGCIQLVLPRIGNLIIGNKSMYCSACECIFEEEHITIASVVVYLECQLICAMLLFMLHRHLIFNVWFPQPNLELEDDLEELMLLDGEAMEEYEIDDD